MSVGRWYLLCCKYGRVKQAEVSLSMIGVKFFCPMMKCERKRVRSQGEKISVVPMFPPYLFISFDPETIPVSKINSSPGVNYLVRFGNEPKPLPQELIDVLMMKTYRKIFSEHVIDYDDRLFLLKGKLDNIQVGDVNALLNILQEMTSIKDKET